MQSLNIEGRRISQLPLELAEKWEMMPIPSHPEPIQDEEIIDLRDIPTVESSDNMLRLILPQLLQAGGKLWTCGGVRGAIVAAGAIDLRYLYFQAEFSLYFARTGTYPKLNSSELLTCQQRVQRRLDLVSKELGDSNTFAGTQFVYTVKGEVDWIPLVRNK
jgi:hypothetical protein